MQRNVSTGKRETPKSLALWGQERSVPIQGRHDRARIRPKKDAHRGNAMFDVLDRQTTLTGNQKKILFAAIIGDALEFFDYFLISYVLAFVIGPWKLTFGQSAIVLLSSGVGAIIGAYAWGWIADRIGRRKVFIGTVLNFSIATGLLYFTPDNGWIYLTAMRFFVGVGVGGLYCVDLPLVQEFMPTSKRGWVGGLVTAVIPLGVGLGAVLAAFMPSDQWRLLFAIGLLPALVVLLVRLWVPESPHWLARQGRFEEARKSLAWALQVGPESLPLPAAASSNVAPVKTNWFDLFKYPRSLLVSWLGNAGAQTGVYGVALWAPALFVLLLKVTPQEAAKMMILLSVTGFLGRLSFSWLSETIGRRNSGGLLGFGAGTLIILAGYNYNTVLFGLSAFWLILAAAMFFADGGFAIVGPYAAEIWPSHLKTTGMGSAYGFGGIGKIIGPAGLALIVGSGNYLKPDVPLPQIPTAFLYLGCWFLMAGVVYYFFGLETKGKSLQQIDRELGVATA
jgi:MFS transporter, putative metabolite:H+ symporter